MAKIKLVVQKIIFQLSLISIPRTSWGGFFDDIAQTKMYTRVDKHMLLYSLVCISLLRETYTRDSRKSSSTACTLVATIASTSSFWPHEHGTITWLYVTNDSLQWTWSHHLQPFNTLTLWHNDDVIITVQEHQVKYRYLCNCKINLSY